MQGINSSNWKILKLNTLKDVSTQTPNDDGSNAHEENFIRQYKSVTMNEVVTFDAGEYDDEVLKVKSVGVFEMG